MASAALRLSFFQVLALLNPLGSISLALDNNFFVVGLDAVRKTIFCPYLKYFYEISNQFSLETAELDKCISNQSSCVSMGKKLLLGRESQWLIMLERLWCVWFCFLLFPFFLFLKPVRALTGLNYPAHSHLGPPPAPLPMSPGALFKSRPGPLCCGGLVYVVGVPVFRVRCGMSMDLIVWDWLPHEPVLLLQVFLMAWTPGYCSWAYVAWVLCAWA